MDKMATLRLVMLCCLFAFLSPAAGEDSSTNGQVRVSATPALATSGGNLVVRCDVQLTEGTLDGMSLRVIDGPDFEINMDKGGPSSSSPATPRIGDAYRSGVKVEGRLTSDTSGYLSATFNNVSCQDANQWRCEAYSSINKELREKIPAIQIHEAPRNLLMHVLPWQSAYHGGQSVALRCSADNAAVLGQYFQWTWRDKDHTTPVPYMRTADIEDSADHRYSAAQGCDVKGGASTLWYTFAAGDDEVEFTCTALGASVSKRFKVLSGPPTKDDIFG